ncbi:recombination-associated protein RdgC [Pseudomonas fluorescens]|uniref:Recombination-associated protein RdgC n=1 Tax=Pseudomonas fluorescens TaxID=294 RepID=A0A5E7N3X4_PSEFL|nr:recombination-associated protein RdgC [Pseudomonas fluorescens]VVP31692.1 Recombination-associated protein RdgC [Pseudomonas fluorescens]
MFSNLHLYRITEPWSLSPTELAKKLEKKLFKPCTDKMINSSGWVEPRPGAGLVYANQRQLLLNVCFEERKVPEPVLQRLTISKAAKIEREKGYKPSRAQLKELRNESLLELLPRAFEHQVTIPVWLNTAAGLIGIDTGTPAKADDVMTILQEAISTPTSLIRTSMDPGSAMASWLMNNEAPDEFTVDREVYLQGLDIEKSKVHYAQLSLERDEVRQHIMEGRRPTKLAMTWDERITFFLTDKFQVKKITFLDSVKAEIPDEEDDEAAYAAMFQVYTEQLTKLVPSLLEALGGEESGEG